MREQLNRLIKKYKDEIKNNKWGDIYYSLLLDKTEPVLIGKFTEAVLSVGYDPLEHMRIIPSYYLTSSTMSGKFVVPHNIKTIAAHAFSGSDIKEIEFNQNLNIIEEHAFENCFNLTQLYLPHNLIKVGRQAFSNCGSINNVIVSSKNCRYGNQVFSHCSSITKIEIPEGTASIPRRMFEGCESLKEVILPYSIDMMSGNIFSGCVELNKLNYAGTIEDFKSIVKSNQWAEFSVIDKVICTDGDLII